MEQQRVFDLPQIVDDSSPDQFNYSDIVIFRLMTDMQNWQRNSQWNLKGCLPSSFKSFQIDSFF